MLPGLYNAGTNAMPADVFVDSGSDATNATSWTFSSINLGSPHVSRHVVVGCGSNSGTTQSLTATLGGTSMTEIVKTDLAVWLSCYLFIVAIPAGSTADLVVTASSSGVLNMSFGAWALYGLYSATADDTAAALNASTLDLSCDVTHPGIAVVFAYNDTGTFSGLTGVNSTDFDHTVESNRVVGGMSSSLATETPRTLSAAWSTHANGVRGVAATWHRA